MPVNFASAASGSTAAASSTYDARFPASGAIDGDHIGTNWESGGGWNDATRDLYPDTLEVDFGATRTIDEIRVYTLQDNFKSAVEPTASTPADLYGIQDFDVQYFDGTNWVTVQNGSITGNDRAANVFMFPDVTTTKIRVVVNAARAHFSRIVEVEAFGCPSQ